MRLSSPATAFAVATVGIACFSAMDAVMKALTIAIGAYNAMFWRMLVGVAIGGTAYFALRSPWPTRAAMRVHLTRGILTSGMGLLFFWGLARVPLAQGVALAFIAPLIALYLAAVILKERIERQAILGSVLGFVGVLVILSAQARGDMGPEALEGAIAILVSALLYAWNIILMRQQAQIARPVEVAFFSGLIVACIYLLAAPFLAELPPSNQLPSILASAVLGFASLILLAWAYARAEAQYLAPVEYSAFIWAVLFGIVIFAEPVRPLTVVGAAMIVAGCIIAARRRDGPVTDAISGV